MFVGELLSKVLNFTREQSTNLRMSGIACAIADVVSSVREGKRIDPPAGWSEDVDVESHRIDKLIKPGS